MPADLRTVTPRIAPGCDIRALPLGPMEGFVLSRVDGQTSAAEIGMLTGLGDGVLPVLEKLSDLGAVEGVKAKVAPASPAPAPPLASELKQATSSAPAPAADGWTGPLVEDGGYRPEELDEEAELDVDKKRRILSVFYALPTLDHYGLLGVPRNADKKAIKSAYYKLAAEFHPDKHFRKNLGAFKQKMESIFKNLTAAEETLSRKESRAEYDGRLGSLDELASFARGRSSRPGPGPAPRAPAPEPPEISSMPSPVGVVAVPAARVGTTPPAPKVTSAPAPAPPPRRPSSAGFAAPPPPRKGGSGQFAPYTPGERPVAPASPASPASPVPPRPPSGFDMRRDALASKLSSGRFPVARPIEPEVISLDPKEAAEQLRRMALQKQNAEMRAQIDRYMEVGGKAAARGDAVAAANSYRFAAALDPTPELQALAEEWGKRATSSLAEGYLRQGETAARDGHWQEAARALVRAAAGMPTDARVLSLAANALVKAEGDLHQAADLARRAAELAPDKLDPRITLAQVYVAANLPISARKELEAAAKIAPDDAKVRALRKQVG